MTKGTRAPSISDKAPLIKHLHEKLRNGRSRIGNSRVPLYLAHGPLERAFANQWPPDPVRRNLPKAIRDDITEEIEMISEWLETNAVAWPLAEWQQTKQPAAAAMHAGMNRRVLALDVWASLAVPARHLDGIVYRLAASRYEFEDPVIGGGVTVDDFLFTTTDLIAADSEEKADLTKSIARWRTTAAVLAVICLALLAR